MLWLTYQHGRQRDACSLSPSRLSCFYAALLLLHVKKAIRARAYALVKNISLLFLSSSINLKLSVWLLLCLLMVILPHLSLLAPYQNGRRGCPCGPSPSHWELPRHGLCPWGHRFHWSPGSELVSGTSVSISLCSKRVYFQNSIKSWQKCS